MNWREEAADKLRRYDAMRQALANIPEELARLEEEARAIKSVQYDKASVDTTMDRKQEDRLLNNLIQRQELSINYSQAQSWMRTTDRALGTLSQQEQQLLQKLYICPERGSISRLCTELGVEQSSIYRRRDKALHRFTLALYGVDS